MAPLALDRAVAPVDHDDRACDISRQIRSQKDGGADDVLRFAGASERRVLEKDAHEVGIVSAYLGIQGRFDQPRTNGIDAHTLLAELGGERAGEAQDPGLGSRVGGRVWRAHMHEGLDRADVDDATSALPQIFQEGMRHVEHTIEVDGHDVVPVLDHRRRLAGKGVAAVNARIVDEDADAANAGADRSGQAQTGRAVSDIERKTPRPSPIAFERRRRLLRGFGVGIERDDCRSGLGIAERNCPTDAGTRAGDGSDVVFEQSTDGRSSLVLRRWRPPRLGSARTRSRSLSNTGAPLGDQARPQRGAYFQMPRAAFTVVAVGSALRQNGESTAYANAQHW